MRGKKKVTNERVKSKKDSRRIDVGSKKATLYIKDRKRDLAGEFTEIAHKLLRKAKKEKKMTGAAETKERAKVGEQEEISPAVQGFVDAMVVPGEPSGDAAKDLEERQKVARQVQEVLKGAGKENKWYKGAVPYAVGEWPPKDEKEASERFFAGDVYGAGARKAEMEKEAKDREALRKAYEGAWEGKVPKRTDQVEGPPYTPAGPGQPVRTAQKG